MNILFLCTGNTCRSRMAEAIFNALNDNVNTKACSAGILAIPNTKTSKNAAMVVKENLNIDISEEDACLLERKMVKEADLILAMTKGIEKTVKNAFPSHINKIFTLNGYVGLNCDILDPFGGDIEVYRQTFKQLYNSILLLNNKLMKDNGIS